MTIPFLWAQRGNDVEETRLAALFGLDLGQLVTVPLGLLIGIVLVARRSWPRPPGYLLAAVTIAFGVIVATQAGATMIWAEGRPSGIGDADGEVVLGMLNAHRLAEAAEVIQVQQQGTHQPLTSSYSRSNSAATCSSWRPVAAR